MVKRTTDFCLTLNSFKREDYSHFYRLHLTKIISHVIIGLEGEKSQPHLQVALRFSEKIRWKEVKLLFPRAHIELARDYCASVEYCKKEGSFMEFGQINLTK